MYMAVAGACAEQAANAGGGTPAALSATVTDPNAVAIASFIGASNPGEIDSTVTVSGGTAPYTFVWKLREMSDPDNILAVASQGTTSNQTYNDSTISTTFVGGFPPPPPPSPGEYRVECKVTDSATPAATVTALSNNFAVNVL